MRNSDVNVQLSIAQIRRLKERVELCGRRLRRLIDENEKNEDRLQQMRKRAATLDCDLKRRLSIGKYGNPEVEGVILRELEKPLDYEIETAGNFQKKMAHVRHLMAKLLVRTSLNEWAAQQEMAEQEREVTARIRDASNARQMLRDVLMESKKKAEGAMIERKNRYEELQRLECQYETCAAGAWLAITERNRLSDRLAILTKQPYITYWKGEDNYDEPQQEKNNAECNSGMSQSSSYPASGGSAFTVTSKQQFVSDSEKSEDREMISQKGEVFVPFNITTTIQKVLHDSLGLDVEFD
ncbi:hypothetical protein DICVIV_12563 [Dictyocaulus viviparus]|uniref:Uncharacterized protein n=1 Tax=Dictyocaulus viviparus TaxID=29172 RepID=A0A0D8XA68_DICVI|nr:hypothetical protein DICVIV_12563 [Dictyocaulus viviparus]